MSRQNVATFNTAEEHSGVVPQRYDVSLATHPASQTSRRHAGATGGMYGSHVWEPHMPRSKVQQGDAYSRYNGGSRGLLVWFTVHTP
jgi:hypothetical protein